MDIISRSIDSLIPYKRNPRDNEKAVIPVMESIREFGFKVPIVIDTDGVIIAGHTRYKAAKRLGLSTVPCIVADDLTEEQVKAFRLADNKVGEIADWDIPLLADELSDITEIDMDQFGFDIYSLVEDGETKQADWFDREELDGAVREEGNDEYNAFVEKFEAKKTTDDCYTPELVYDAVADWVAEKYSLNRKNFVRPFYPGGDYQKEKYKKSQIVVDNPPFSILAEIIRFYEDKGIKYFLFAPSLTIFSSSSSSSSSCLCIGAGIEYENGAIVDTSFVTNLEDCRFRSDPGLYQKIKEAVDTLRAETKKAMPKYEYPYEVVLSTMLNRYSKYGVEYEVSKDESERIRELESQKEYGKAIFGSGYLVSERAAAERAAAERAAAERVAAYTWVLSEKELAVVKALSKGADLVDADGLEKAN